MVGYLLISKNLISTDISKTLETISISQPQKNSYTNYSIPMYKTKHYADTKNHIFEDYLMLEEFTQ